MPGRAQTARRATQRPTHGSVTGNNAIALRKEQAEAVRDAQQRMSMIGTVSDVDEVTDLTDEAVADREAAAEAEANTPEDVSLHGLSITALPRERPRKGLRSVSKDGKQDPNEPVEVRFVDDFPGVTLGKGEDGVIRNFDFEAGRKYRVPAWVAEHLGSKEMLV